MCWQKVGLSLEDRKPFFYLDLSAREIGSGKGEDKCSRNTFDDSKDCRETAVRMGKRVRSPEAVEWQTYSL